VIGVPQLEEGSADACANREGSEHQLFIWLRRKFRSVGSAMSDEAPCVRMLGDADESPNRIVGFAWVHDTV
jgi:hypothetical protein